VSVTPDGEGGGCDCHDIGRPDAVFAQETEKRMSRTGRFFKMKERKWSRMLDTFDLLGEAYVHGLMNGEVLKLPGREEQIYLY
jgi:hypothetical protein